MRRAVPAVTATRREGRLYAINVSDGGVPKRPRVSADIHADGVEGDRQRNLLFHGGPSRAVSLYSLDLIERLQQEGHPITPGAIGENLTIADLPWELMTPGRVVAIGDVQLELTRYADPCRTIAQAFTGRQFGRVSQRRHQGWSRVYARVLREGRVSIGAPVTIVETLA